MRPNANSILVAMMILVITAFSASQAIADVNDSKVRRWIARGYLTLDCTSPADEEADLTTTIPAEKVYLAWEFLKACRDGGSPGGLELAAAEHYLFIRAASCNTGDTFYRVLPAWYASFKSLATYAGLQQYLQTSTQPVTPTDTGVVRWGELGVTDGLRDFKSLTGQDPSLKASGLTVGFAFLKDRFY
jgi:hypothetical protein